MKNRINIALTSLTIIILTALAVTTTFAESENTTTNTAIASTSYTAAKNLKINIKNAYKTKIPIGTVKKLKIDGQEGDLTVKSSKPSIIKITKNNNLKAKKPGKATITIKTNGITIKRKVKSVVKLKITYTPIKKLTLNSGLTYKIRDLYKYKTNMQSLQIYISDAQWYKMLDKVDNKVDNPKATTSNKKIISCGTKYVTAKERGKAKITVKCGKQKFKISVNITKLNETNLKGKKAKVAYSGDELFKEYQDMVMNYVIKGETPKYEYIYCSFKEAKNSDKIAGYINDGYKKCYDNPNYCYNFLNAGFDVYTSKGKNAYSNNAKGPFFVKIFTYSKEDNKKLYNTAQNILKSINIDSFKEDYEKITALQMWFTKYCEYGDWNPRTDSNLHSIQGLLYKHKGICSDYSFTTNYFCAILKIPSTSISSPTHEWNLVKIGDKWYHLDFLHKLILYGTNELEEYSNKLKEANYEKYKDAYKVRSEFYEEHFKLGKNNISKTSYPITVEEKEKIEKQAGF